MKTIIVRVFSEKKSHITNSSGRIICENDEGKRGLRSGESLVSINGFTAFLSNHEYLWLESFEAAITKAKKFVADAKSQEATFGRDTKICLEICVPPN